MENVTIAQVCIDQTIYRIDKPYDYLLPKALMCENPVGKRVLVPFGNGTATRQGFVLSISDKTDCPKSKLKQIVTVLDEKPILNDEMLKLAVFLKERTFCTYFDALRVLLPAGISMRVKVAYTFNGDSDTGSLSADEAAIADYLKTLGKYEERDKLLRRFGFKPQSQILEKMLKKDILSRNDFAEQKLRDPTVKMVRLINDRIPEKLTAKQKAVVEQLQKSGDADVKELCYFLGITPAVVTGLCNKGAAELYNAEVVIKPDEPTNIKKPEIQLSKEQYAAYDSLKKQCENGYSVSLLYGVTGSGKTQVFLKAADDVVAMGRGVIVMVPEIALTPQTISIFTARYGNRVAVIHSAMSQRERMNEWRRIKNGEALVAVGTRSAAFAPFSNLGLVIIDEEQEHTYKSEQSPKFHARDVAKFRCAYHGAVLVLASATPSVESYCAAVSGKYKLLPLKKRYGKAVLPKVTVVDMRNEFHGGNRSVLSRELLDRLSETLQKKQQAILLMNRRGYNTYVSCPNCGDVVTCPNCSISMIYHAANGRLMCHYCGYSVPYTQKCQKCGGEHMKYLGVGTQKVEEELGLIFGDARILRMDADTTLAKDSYRKKLTSFSNGDYDIMLGTQMVAKGLDFEKVTLVGVLNADMAMHSADYKSYERAFSLLTQVVGRSGRGKNGGTAVIQTVQPDSDLIRLAAKQDYNSFYNDEILSRKLYIFPPYCEMAKLMFQSMDYELSKRGAAAFFELIVKRVKGNFNDLKLNILGPTADVVPKINKKYRHMLFLKFRNFKRLKQLLEECLEEYYSSDIAKSTTVSIDIDPE